MKAKTIFLFLFVIMRTGTVPACTTFLLSGQYTSDGRPLLFKQRDTGEEDNKIEILTTGRYRCIGIVNSRDTDCREIYGGYNEAGFAIINSANYNLNGPEEQSEIENDGLVMRRVLQNCATLTDFEQMLDSSRWNIRSSTADRSSSR